MINAIQEVEKTKSFEIVTKTPPHVTHGGTFAESLLCIDTNCPQVEADWYVLTDKNTYKNFMDTTTQKIRDLIGNRNIILSDRDIQPSEYLSAPPEGKIWLGVHVFVY